MVLTIEQILNANTDEDLLKLLSGELQRFFPPEVRKNPVIFLSRLYAAPAGLRAMAATYELDVSLALDDLAWHFVNHHGLFELAEETIFGLRELEAQEAADIFQSALAIIKPHWQDLNQIPVGEEHEWLDSKGIQTQMNPLNERMWKSLKQYEDNSLMSLWPAYARKHPERCVTVAGRD